MLNFASLLTCYNSNKIPPFIVLFLAADILIVWGSLVFASAFFGVGNTLLSFAIGWLLGASVAVLDFVIAVTIYCVREK